MVERNSNPEVDYERISILHDNAKFGYLGMTIAVSFLAVVIANFSTSRVAITWMSVVVISYLPRVSLSILFSRKSARREINKDNIGPWERHFFLSSILPFICFSAAVFMPYGESRFEAITYYAVIVMSLLAGGVLTYSTSLPALVLFMRLSMLPLIAMCYWMQEFMSVALGLTLTFAYFLLSRLMTRLEKLLLENITLKIENQHQSLTDPLTKLGNRRRLLLHIKDLIPVSLRRGEQFSIILLDIDHFKIFNDENGHSAGDKLLVELSKILVECSRDQDLVIRYGGEEFLLVLPSTSLEAASVLTERIRAVTKERTRATISAGLAMHSDQEGFEQLVQRADKSLYKAKESGRNKYVLAEAVSR
ncbi:MAG: GGDEF domain-containing protein [Gammaproteobacteria bacterium]|nr:hypothetical protein [Gammaproteobacteria bacterium]MDP6096756.1 GGDEF domain-containing protein [Gammaproteobacteria bacterium]MDP7455716.1 GGDEF domain-containing protein [Gammaproteobacteria bacterium]